MSMPVARAVVLGVALTLMAACALTAQALPDPAHASDTLTLRDAIAAALARGPELAAARAQVDAAQEGRAQARAAWLPSLTVGGTFTRFEEPMLAAPIHSFRPTNLPEFARTLTQGRLTASWTVFDGGARSARIAGTGARVQGAEATAHAASMDAVLETVEAYLALLGARDALAAQRTREEELVAELARAERLVAEGAAPRLEQLRAEAELDAVRAQGVSAEAALVVAEAELGRITGLPSVRIAQAALAEVRAPPAAGLTASAPAPDHPLLLQARARVAAAEALTREAGAALLPRVSGTGGVTEYGQAWSDFTGEWQAGLVVDYPIFTGGSRRARVDELRAEVRRARAEAQAVAEDLASASARARAAVVEADARTAALATAAARFEELARVEALALAEGAGVQSDYLRALAALHGARVALADGRRAEVAMRARLARVHGRLDLAWIEAELEGER